MIVYFLLNQVNLKGYVGQHKGNKISSRWGSKLQSAHNQHLKNAVLKYGYKVFSREILNVCSSQAEMNNLERLWISILRTYDSNFGYNESLGGYPSPMLGKKHKDTTKIIMSEKRKSWWKDPKNEKERDTLCYKNKVFNTGKKLSTDCKLRISESNKGRKTSEEARRKISNLIWVTNGISNKRIPKSSPIFEGWMLGRIGHSEETKLKMRKTHKNRFKDNPELCKLQASRFSKKKM